MKIEAVIVCVNYSDFLCWTLPFNKVHFDNVVVVTDKNDIKTQKICEYWHVKCIKEDIDGDEFPKGRLINVGLDNLNYNDWVAHIDSDIYLPSHFSRTFRTISKDNESLYTMDRMMCKNFGDWIRFLEQPKIQFENDIFVHHGPFELGTRVASLSRDGALCIGYFQLWNQGKMKLRYEEKHTSAARGDMAFSMKFPRNKRQFLNECIAIHLETPLHSGEIIMGQNWDGRKSMPFTLNTFLDHEQKTE